ncbi:MAG: Holliday junction branch migration protein RuvA [Acutalibacteraceae bacterium]
MLYSLRGKLIHREATLAVVECGGVGYACNTTINTQKQLKDDSEVLLYTYMSVREDAVDLFGFATQTELKTFKMLIGINGVGPKAGIAILSELSCSDLAIAISTGDYKTITRANGVGPKLAQRIVLELKDKIKGLSSSSDDFDFDTVSVSSQGGNISKAVEALSVLGFTSSEVNPVLAKMDKDTPVEVMIGETLRKMGKK